MNNSIMTWPEHLKEEALYGLAGEILKAIEPHTEADPVAILGTILTLYGNSIGRNSYFYAEADRHTCQLYTCLIGETSKGRKGVSFGQGKVFFEGADEEWLQNCISGGLSTGEGLVYAVRDEVREGDKVVIEGVDDKRIMVLEKEFASTLKIAKRPGNTLSSTLRCAWDSGNLKFMTKNTPIKSTGAHISILAHITKEELHYHMGAIESANGFGNRFLWLCVRRSKLLPDGGRLDEIDIAPLKQRLAKAIEFGKMNGEIKRDHEAKALWHEVYPMISEGKPGVSGALMGRSEAQVMRIACIYALLDLSNTIQKVHLKAALALWDYVEDSIEYLFGHSLGDDLAGKIMNHIKEEKGNGTTRSSISCFLGRNKDKHEIDKALDLLSERNLIVTEKKKSGSGRLTEYFYESRCG